MATGRIGDITLDIAHEVKGRGRGLDVASNSAKGFYTRIISSGHVSGVDDNITILLPQSKAWDIEGLIRQGYPLWIDTSYELGGRQTPVRGWYNVAKMELTDLAGDHAWYDFDLNLITPDQNAFIEMDYTSGEDAGTQMYSSYPNTTTNTIVDDSFSTVTSYWSGVWGDMTGQSANRGSGNLVMSGRSEAAGTWRSLGVNLLGLKQPPFIFETSFDLAATSTYQYEGWIYLYVNGQGDHIRYGLVSLNNVPTLYLQKIVNGAYITFRNGAVVDGSSIKLAYYPDGDMEAWVNQGNGYVKWWGKGNSGLVMPKDIIIGYRFGTNSNTQVTMNSSFFTLYSIEDITGTNIVYLPVDTRRLLVEPDFYRQGMEGLIPGYANPTDPLYFIPHPQSINKGGVKAYSTDVDSGVTTRIYNINEQLDPNGLFVHNSLVGLETDVDGINYYLWDYPNNVWKYMNKFYFDYMYPLNLYHISPDNITFQVEDTYWHLGRGKQFVNVEHPNTTLPYDLLTSYYHDGVTTANPLSNVLISMDTQDYTRVYKTAYGNWALLFIRNNPGDIKSDSLPPDYATGIGFANIAINGDYHKDTDIVNEYKLQTRQSIQINRP